MMSQESSSAGSIYLASNLKLRGEENYSLWKRSIENLAIMHDLQDHYHPKAPKPPKQIDVYGKEANSDEIVKFKEWQRKDARMKLIITGNLSISLASQVENLDTARAMWEALQNQLEGSGIVLYIQASSKFSSMKCSDYSNLDEFIFSYKQTMELLAQFKMNVREADAVIFFVEKVKDDYPVWAMNMRTRLRALKQIDDIKISLLDEFVRYLRMNLVRV